MRDPLFICVGSSRSDGVRVRSHQLMNLSWEIRHLRTFLLAVSSDSHGILFKAACQFLQRLAFLFEKLPLRILRRN